MISSHSCELKSSCIHVRSTTCLSPTLGSISRSIDGGRQSLLLTTDGRYVISASPVGQRGLRAVSYNCYNCRYENQPWVAVVAAVRVCAARALDGGVGVAVVLLSLWQWQHRNLNFWLDFTSHNGCPSSPNKS